VQDHSSFLGRTFMGITRKFFGMFYGEKENVDAK
jgi:hypothetical protein